MKAQLTRLNRAGKGLLLAGAALLWAGTSAMGAEYQLEKHRIQWSGSMPAQAHTGLLTPQHFAASITDEGSIDSLEVILDMKSIDVTDLEGKKRTKLIGHLSSEDFFFVDEYPTASFSLEQYRDGESQGTITIRGIAKPMTLPITVTRNGESGWILSGVFTFDRQDFNVNYQNGGFFGVAKDKLIRDAVELDIELVVAPASEPKA